MNRYIEQQNGGELWIRELNDKVYPASNLLSNIYSKYYPIDSTFYSELTSNQILRFDMFDDVIFIETASASIFEKFTYANDVVVPFNQKNLLNKKTNINNAYLTNVDYWYDEYKRTIYFVEILPKDESINGISFDVIFKQFDCETGSIVKSFEQYTKLVFLESVSFSDFILENPKITYNSDTKLFNTSLVVRIEGVFGLLSFNIVNFGDFRINDLNGFFPNKTLNKSASETYKLT